MFWQFVAITNPLSSVSSEEKIRGKKMMHSKEFELA